MQLLASTVLLLSTTSALTLQPRATCPAVWKQVVAELEPAFQGCNRLAHGTIRAAFHDCFNNACDGSLVLTSECGRAENAGLPNTCAQIKAWATKYSVSVADMIQFSAATAVATCTRGPKVRALVGRKDSSVAATEGLMPTSKESVDKILAGFAAKGFSAVDVVALVGAHSAAIMMFDDPSKAQTALDSTPSVFDIKFYAEVKAGTAPYILQSDKLLSNHTKTAATWDSFAKYTNIWSDKFVDAWNRFAVIGNTVSSLEDCTSLVSSIKSSKKKRDPHSDLASPQGLSPRLARYAKLFS